MDFLVIAGAVYTALMLAAITLYCVKLVSLNQPRRAISVLFSSLMTLTGSGATIFFLIAGVKGFLIFAAGFVAIIGGIWLVRDLAFPMDQEPHPGPRPR